MLFDVQAALQEILGAEAAAAGVVDLATVSRTKPAPSASSAPKAGNGAAPTCAICGRSDWTVSLTDIDRRRMHVSCWKAEKESRGTAVKAR